MSNLKPIKVTRVRVRGAQIFNLRSGWSTAHSRDHLFDCSFSTLDVGFNAAVRTISDPTGDAELSGLLPRPCPEEDPLDSAIDLNKARNGLHQ